MAEDITEVDEGAATDPDDTSTTGDPELGDPGKKALQEERRKARTLAAELRKTNAELDKLREAAMSEQEKAVAEARKTGAAEAAKASAPRLVRAELRAAAAEAGLGKEALDGFLEYADLGRFVGEDGEPDSKAITAAVTKLGGAGRGTDFDGGARTTGAKPTDMNSLIRRQAGLG